MEYLLLSILIALTLVSFGLLGKDPFSPGFLMCAAFVFSVLCMCYNKVTWDINTCALTVEIVILGCFFFVCGNLIAQGIYHKRIFRAGVRNRKNQGCINLKNNEFVYISKNLVFFIFLFDFVVVVLYFIQVVRIAGFGSFTSMMYIFRRATGFEGERVSFIVNILLRITKAFSTIFIYYFINNLMSGKPFKSQAYLLFPLVPDLICGMLTGGRFRLLQIILGPVIIYGVLYFIRNGRRIKLRFKILTRILLITVLSLFLFYGIRQLVGRDNQTDIFTYVTEYFGGPVELFDVVLRGDVSFHQPEVFGRNTFATILGYINRFTGLYIGAEANPGFLLSRTGINLGNVYTCFFKYFADFGTFGVCIISLVNGIIWSSFYYTCLLKKNNAWRIIYAFVFHGLFFQFYDEMTYTIFLSIDNWMTFGFIILFEKYIRTRIRIN